MEKTNPSPRLHPRKLARSMAKARTGMNRLFRLDLRKAAADQRKGARQMEKTNPSPRLHPRKLARSMAKARTGMNRLSRLDWRKAAADQRKGVRIV